MLRIEQDKFGGRKKIQISRYHIQGLFTHFYDNTGDTNQGKSECQFDLPV